MAFFDALKYQIAKLFFHVDRQDFYEDLKAEFEQTDFTSSDTLVNRLKTVRDRDRNRSGWSWPVYSRLVTRLSGGEKFSEAIRRFVPGDEYMLIEACETRGGDSVARGVELAQLAAVAKAKLAGAVNAGVAYPLVLLGSTHVLTIGLGLFAFPPMTDLFPVKWWPTIGQFLIWMCDFNVTYWLPITALILAFTWLYVWSIKRWSGRLRNQIDAIPLLYRNKRDMRAAMLIVALAGLFSSGLSFEHSLDRLIVTADPWLKWHLQQMRRKLKRNPHLQLEAIDTGLFADRVLDKILDASNRGDFEGAVKKLGHASLDRVIKMVQRSSRVANVLLLAIAATWLGFVGVGSVYSTGMVSFKAQQIFSKPTAFQQSGK